MILQLALRNVLRNRRRSLATILMIAVGTTALLVFGAFMLFSGYGLQTVTVRANGHIAVYQKNYFIFGAGNPAAWGIPDYESLLKLIRRDSELAPMLVVATPVQAISGIISNADNNTSKTFFGTGFVPSERDQMRAWNEYGTGSTSGTRSGLDDADSSKGIAGVGMAKVLGLCVPLHLADCPPLAPRPEGEKSDLTGATHEDFSFLNEHGGAETFEEEVDPTVQLLGATVAGVPNVVDVSLHRGEFQGVKALDDNYVGLHLKLAQQLTYGRQAPQVTGIVLLLHRTEQLDAAKERLSYLFKAHHLNLELRDFTELSPIYRQAIGLYEAFFLFISIIIGVVVIFSVGNAVSMSVVERTNEIGTLRALGLRRATVRRQFVLEGGVIGMLGATCGVILAFAIAYFVNGSGLSWTPPGNAQAVPIRLYMSGDLRLPMIIWISLVAVAIVASLLPAFRAARLTITDALRYV